MHTPMERAGRERAPKWALITGAGVRVGRALALTFAQAGFDLLLHANRSRAGVEEVAARARALGRDARVFQADLSREEEVDRLVAEVRGAVEGLEVLVHNAAIYEQRPFAAIDRPSYRRMQAINLEAPFFLTQALLPLFEGGASPSVIHIGDIGGERADPGYAHYAVSKAGLLMLTRALAVELAPRVRVNAISPGTVAFPEGLDEAERRAILARIPMGREGACEDVARTALFLAEDAPYLTGQIIDVDGGRSALL